MSEQSDNVSRMTDSASTPPGPPESSTPVSGLTAQEVSARVSAGQVNSLPPRSGRTTAQIVRDNVLTRINALLGVLFVLVMATGSWINGAFGLLIIANSIIGIIQELRAKHTLDSLAVVGEAHPTVRREGVEQSVAQDAVVLDDILVLSPGDQAVVDGIVSEAAYLEMDESLLTGESDPVAKHPGDPVMSGSFVSSGTGSYQATRVGSDSYAAKLTSEAAKFSLVHSDLQAGINSILKVITWILIPVGILTIVGQVRIGEHDWRAIILAVTGALVPMIPEGLVLITSTAFALGVIRLGSRNCLVNELPAIEGLARVDVVCADKTGTLTENTMEFSELRLFAPTDSEAGVSEEEAAEVLAQLGAADSAPNSSMAAIIDHVGSPHTPWEVTEVQPFTSAKKWSGVTFATHGNWVLGAPDVLTPPDSPHGKEADSIASSGLRVLLLAACSAPVTDTHAPGNVRPIALVILDQKVRPDAAPTLEYFKNQGVEVKVISGDNADSVGAVTRSLGMDSGTPVDARHIDADSFDDVINSSHVFGRVTPDQKREMVSALKRAGRTVAMTGDGVNDVLALKDADLGVAMGSGTPATRSVAKIVLLDDRFSTLPYVVAEGRRVIGNIERVANLFLTKTVYSSILAILVLLFSLPFPFQPIHVTITGWFTIGIPAFLLSLPPNNERARGGFVARVMRFGLPAGVIVAVASFITYISVRNPQGTAAEATQASTAALVALIIASTWVLATVARPYEWWKILLVLLPLLGYWLIFTLPLTQKYFMLDSSNGPFMLFGIVAGLIGAAAIEVVWWIIRAYSGEKRPLWLPREQREAARAQRRIEREEKAHRRAAVPHQ